MWLKEASDIDVSNTPAIPLNLGHYSNYYPEEGGVPHHVFALSDDKSFKAVIRDILQVRTLT
jgi:hypothetical protein